MGATANIQAPLPVARFDPCAPLRAPGTKSRRTENGLAAYRRPADGLPTHFPVTRRVVGDESFGAMSRRFIISEQSVPATRLHNLETFPSFLALVARPFLEVEVWRVPPGGYAFISALLQGRTIAAATDAGIAADPKFDIATNRALLVGANVVVGIQEHIRAERLNA
jgi:hypothetical protein